MEQREPHRICQYKLEITDTQKVQMPKYSRIFSVGNQNGDLCLWALTENPTYNLEDITIDIVGTGDPMDTDLQFRRKFIGTVVINPFVWHVFERV